MIIDRKKYITKRNKDDAGAQKENTIKRNKNCTDT